MYMAVKLIKVTRVLLMFIAFKDDIVRGFFEAHEKENRRCNGNVMIILLWVHSDP